MPFAGTVLLVGMKPPAERASVVLLNVKPLSPPKAPASLNWTWVVAPAGVPTETASRLPVIGLKIYLIPIDQLLVTEMMLSLPSYTKVSVATVVPPEPPVLYTTPVRLVPV